MDRRQDNSVDSQDASDLSLSADVTRLADESHFAPARIKVCPEVRLLRRLFEGNLDAAIEQRLMQHIDACATCERTFQANEGVWGRSHQPQRRRWTGRAAPRWFAAQVRAARSG